MSDWPLAIQLWTVRDALAKDAAATFHTLHQLGYRYVEVAAMDDKSADEIVALLDDAGLAAMGAHIPLAKVTGETDAAIAHAQALGVSYAAVPWIGPEDCLGRDAWVAAARAMDTAGQAFRETGITLCYHHHGHEFDRVDGDYIFDVIMDNADPEHLAAEIDTYWAQFGGVDPIELMRRYAGRCPLLHIKDMANDPARSFAEVGHGVLDWDAIFDAATNIGVKWCVVEQDESTRGSLESAGMSAEFLLGRTEFSC
jgi:sugar phosphate isomerase/epimerase